MIFFKPSFSTPLSLQDDHYWRVADICFRHLKGAYDNYKHASSYEWHRKIENNDPQWGKSQWMHARKKYGIFESEEYTQAMAAVLFAHIWLLSAANYYRQSVKIIDKSNVINSKIDPISCSTPLKISEQLNMPPLLNSYLEKLHGLKNTITHLVENDPKTENIGDLSFPQAFKLIKATWIVYIELLKHYGKNPDVNSWLIMIKKYDLPRSLS